MKLGGVGGKGSPACAVLHEVHTSVCRAGCHASSPPQSGHGNCRSPLASVVAIAAPPRRRTAAVTSRESLDEIADDPPCAVGLALQRHRFAPVDFLGERRSKQDDCV